MLDGGRGRSDWLMGLSGRSGRRAGCSFDLTFGTSGFALYCIRNYFNHYTDTYFRFW